MKSIVKVLFIPENPWECAGITCEQCSYSEMEARPCDGPSWKEWSQRLDDYFRDRVAKKNPWDLLPRTKKAIDEGLKRLRDMYE